MTLRLLTIALLFTSLFATGQTKVGTIDSELIVALMPELKSVNTRLTAYTKKLDSSYQIKVKEYQDKVAAFQKLGDVSDNFKKIKVDEIAELEKGLQTGQDNGNKLIQLKKNELMRPLYKILKEAIDEVAKTNGYTQIMTTTGNQFVYIDPKYDITQTVMDKLGLKLPEPKK